jgi:urease accessory protein UreF
VQVEWSRARARKVRWEEEVLTLREEMRRVLRYLGWQSQWWRDHVKARDEDIPELAAGIQAYALKQADLHDRLAGFYQRKWNTSASAAARRIVALEDAAVAEEADLGEFFQ